jgi:TIR domain
MARQTVEISLWPNEGRAPGGQPDLQGVGELVDQTYPSNVVFEASVSPETGVICDLDTAFDSFTTTDVEGSADAFRRAIVRLEGETGFQALWGAEARGDRSSWTYLQPRVRDARLPSGKPLAFSLPMAPVARKLFRHARLHDATFSYRVELVRANPQPDRVRPLIPALAELQQRAPSMTSVAEGLRNVLELARREGWRANESFGARSSENTVKPWLEEAVIQHVTETEPFLSRDLIEMTWLAREDLTVEAADLDSFVLGLRPRGYSRTAIDSASIESPPVQRTTLTSQGRARAFAAGKGKPYIFLSYAHKNRDFAEVVMNFLGSAGASFWWDDGIEPGSIWDEALEERISNCTVLMPCVSADYQSSKYCRRELKFADLLSKPILPVAQQAVTWSDGLRFMFQELQICVLASNQSWERLRGGLTDIAASVFQDATSAERTQ